MAGELIYAFRVMRLPLLDAGGSTIGRLDDIVVIPGRPGVAPRVLGFVATSQRRRIFVNANRLAGIDSDGARLRSWDVDLNPFKPKPGEVLIGRDVIDRRIGDETVSDVAMRAAGDGRQTWWQLAKVRLARRSALRRRPSYRLVDVAEVPELFRTAGSEVAAEVARLRDMHPSDVAGVVRSMPLTQRKQLAEAMDDERLADLLEELPEAEQLRIIEGLDLERLVNVLDEMEYDDLADLLAEMPGEQRTRILEAMDAEDADLMRRLLSYDEGTAGALMTPDIIILGPTATVAEALGRAAQPGLAGVDRRPGVRRATAVQAADRHVRRRRSLPAAAARTAQPGARPVHRRRADDHARHARARGRRTAGELQHAGRWACATRPVVCSAPSPSTTCSTARCRPGGGSAGG